MKSTDQDITVKVDAYTRVCLSVIAVLLTVLIVGLWADVWPERTAQAAIPVGTKANVFKGSAVGRDDLVRVSQGISTKLDRLMVLLKSGQVKVQVKEGSPAGKGGAVGGKSVVPKKK